MYASQCLVQLRRLPPCTQTCERLVFSSMGVAWSTARLLFSRPCSLQRGESYLFVSRFFFFAVFPSHSFRLLFLFLVTPHVLCSFPVNSPISSTYASFSDHVVCVFPEGTTERHAYSIDPNVPHVVYMHLLDVDQHSSGNAKLLETRHAFGPSFLLARVRGPRSPFFFAVFFVFFQQHTHAAAICSGT